MRTTVSLDADVERLLKDAMHRSRRSFKETLNRAIRTALGGEAASTERLPFEVTARPLGLRGGIDPTSFNKLADNLEAEAFVDRQQRNRS